MRPKGTRRNVIDLMGPNIKGLKRMMDKARQGNVKADKKKKTRQVITDPLRAKFASTDPYVLAFACALLERLTEEMHAYM